MKCCMKGASICITDTHWFRHSSEFPQFPLESSEMWISSLHFISVIQSRYGQMWHLFGSFCVSMFWGPLLCALQIRSLWHCVCVRPLFIFCWLLVQFHQLVLFGWFDFTFVSIKFTVQQAWASNTSIDIHWNGPKSIYDWAKCAVTWRKNVNA